MARQETDRDTTARREYPLGHSAQETKRLMYQADVFAPMTRRLFIEAGISSGMRVLDLGSGAGDVAFIAAELVGDTGEVVGVDNDAGVLATARERATAAGITNVSFIEGDLSTIEPSGMFDAMIGRLILLYQPDPAATIRRFLPYVRSDGHVAFAEFDFMSGNGLPPVPLLNQAGAWWHMTMDRIGLHSRMGPELYATLLDAGLPEPKMIAEAVISGPASSPIPMILAGLLRSVQPDMVRLGIVTEAELAVETLEERMRAEAVALRSCLTAPLLIGAWSRVP